MKFRQRALLFHKANVRFEEKMLHYQVEEEKACVDFSILYERIDKDSSPQSYRERSLTYLGFVFACTSVLVQIIVDNNALRLRLILVITSLICMVAAHFARFDATVIPTRGC